MGEAREGKVKIQRRLNSREAATYLGISYSKLTKWRTFGGGPKYIKLSERVVYDIAELDNFMDRNTRENTSQPQVKW